VPRAGGRRQALQRVGGLELDGVRHAGALGVAAAKSVMRKAHVAGEHRHRRCMHGARASCFICCQARAQRLEGQQALEGEAALQAGGDAAGDLRGLDGDGAGAAAGVEQRAVSARPCQPAAASIAAASVSFSGASPFTPWLPPRRQPRLNSASPEVSTYSDAWSGPRCSTSGRSGWRGVDAGALAGGLAQRVAHRVLDAQRGEVQARSGERCA
jgi:hypothetical protein